MKDFSLTVSDLGLCSYEPAWQLQKQLQKKRIADEIPDTFLLCQHHPVITSGSSTKEDSLLVDSNALTKQGVEQFRVERGGDATFHGPGQIVGYPIFNLNNHKRDVHWYMRALESVVISTLKHFGINAHTVPGRTGVWTAWDENASNSNSLRQHRRKIASIGVRISRWCTMHGFALNVRDLSAGFALINPCGFSDITVTSIDNEWALQKLSGSTPSLDEVQVQIIKNVVSVFGFSSVVTTSQDMHVTP